MHIYLFIDTVGNDYGSTDRKVRITVIVFHEQVTCNLMKTKCISRLNIYK